MGRFLTYVAIGVVLAFLLQWRWNSAGETTATVFVPNASTVEQTVDRTEAGEAFGDLFGGEAPAREIPKRPAPRGDTPIYTSSGRQ